MNAPRHVCPHCQGTGYAPDLSDALIEATADGLREACRVAGKPISGDDRIDEATAAMLISRKPKTLCNWRHTSRPIPFLERGRRISYSIPDIARWMQEGGTLPANEA